MRTFAKFPSGITCPICKTSNDKECFLMPIDGTDDDGNCEAAPTHVDCLLSDRYRYNREAGIVYRFVEEGE